MTNIPEILLEQLKPVQGFDREQFLAAHGKHAVTSIRLNPRKLSGAFDNYNKVPWCELGYYLPQRPVFTKDPLHHAGAYYVQEASSMFLQHVLQQVLPGRENLRVLDLCAAPGGKSTLIASLLSDTSLLISNEVIRSRASILEENVTRWGHMNNWVTSNDPADFGKLEGYFDVIVVDAPCSGSGLFRKDEKAIGEWSERNVELCGQRQQRILADIWPALKQGGLLIYATCSYSPQEDEDILDWIGDSLEADTTAVLCNTEWGIVETSSVKHHFKGYRFFPHLLYGEGFFIAAIKKTGEAGTLKPAKFKSAQDSKVFAQCKHLLYGNWICIPHKEEYLAIHPEHERDLSLLKKYLYFRKVGIALGQPAKNDWVPAHDVALSVNREANLLTIELNKEGALKFLKKEESGMGDIAKGWYIVTYNGLGLGWIKALGNRINNYLPKNWRIRMDISDEDEA